MNFGDIDLEFQRRAVLEGGCTLPSFFKISDDDQIEDIRAILNSYNGKQLSENVKNLSFRYGLDKDTIVLLYIFGKYGETITKEQYTNFVKEYGSFASFQIISLRLTRFISLCESQLQNIRKELNDFDQIVSQLDNFQSQNYLLTIEEKIIEQKLKLKANIESVFDDLDLSDDYIFIRFVSGEKEWVKTEMLPENLWIEQKPEIPTIFVKIKGGHSLTISSFRNDTCNVLIKYIVGESFTETNLIKSVGRFLSNVKYKQILKKEIGIKTKFIIPDTPFNKAIFVDIVSTDPLFKKFFFFNDNGKGILSKRYTLYYKPNQTLLIRNSIAVTLSTDESDSLRVRISRAKSVDEIKEFQKVFSKLLKIYADRKPGILATYKKLLPVTGEILKTFEPKVKKKVADKKSGSRLLKLKTQRPYYFRSGYASNCQPKDHQPYLLTQQEINEFPDLARRMYGEDVVWEHLLLEFPNRSGGQDTYACIPREDSDKSMEYIYPGLRKNSKSTGKYKEEVPYFPCCYSTDQYTKQGSRIFQDMNQTENKQSKHIFGPNKMLPPNRLGKIPYNLTYLAEKIGFANVKKGKQMVLPLLRLGVEVSPSSLIHCFETAFNEKFLEMSVEMKEESVRNKRIEMSMMENYNIASQELYGMDEEYLRNKLDSEDFLDDRLWIRLLEDMYNCQAFVFSIDKKCEKGCISLPRYCEIYFSPPHLSNLQTVVIFKTFQKGSYQYEILTDVSKEKAYFTNEKFIEAIISIFNEANIVSRMKLNKVSKDKPETLEYPSAQCIDSKGKLRLLFFDNICVSVPPSNPLNIKTQNEISRVTVDQALSFCKENNLEIKYQDVNDNGLITGLWTKELRYIYIVESERLEGVEKQIDGLEKYMIGGSESKLCRLHRSRKIAKALQEHTLFEYSKNKDVKFKVIPDYEYSEISSVFSENKDIYRDGKIIVNNLEIKNRLLFHLKNNLLQDNSFVERYKNLYNMNDYYTSIFDFKKQKIGHLFLEKSALKRWMERAMNKNYIFSNVMINTIHPYYYKNFDVHDGKLLIVQNVEGGKKDVAAFVSENWNKNSVNLGYLNSKISDISPSVYSVAGKMEDGDKEISVLKYYNGYYAALLHIENE